ncbi:MAG TPA: outer membrane lipoprotein carrier protein LolA [Bacteroidales bacterium]|nr:outer membrane lipoprotein carrier protein LolA [Bacteroidales bacterium]
MKKVVLFVFMSILLTFNALSQNDPKAITLLDKFSSIASTAPSVSMKFMLITVDQMKNTNDSLTGSVILCKDNYKLELPDNIIWFNGETSWSYLPDEQEVTITKPNKKDNSFQSQPSLIFSMYKKGYKCRLVEEKQDSYTIDLYPVDIKNDIIRVRLVIEKPSMVLKSFEYKRRDGIIITLLVNDYDLKEVPALEIFTFPQGKYKDADINDMR